MTKDCDGMENKDWHEKKHWINLKEIASRLPNCELRVKVQDGYPVSVEVEKVEHTPIDLTK